MSEHDNNNDNNDRAVERDYAVGYCRPPKSSQFQPGQSGNPKGRKRAPLSVQAQMRKVVSRKVQINEGGKTKRLPLQDVIFRTIANKAAKGDLNAAKFVFNLMHAAEYAETDVIDQTSLPPDDQAMLDEMMKRFAEPDASEVSVARDAVEEESAPANYPPDQDEIISTPNDFDDKDEAHDR